MNNKCPSVAVDVICYHVPTGKIALIERKYPPLGFAIPGGFVDDGETVEAAAKREMKEELNLDIKSPLRFLGYYDNPDRDPRRHVISFVFVAKISDMPVAGDDAKTVTLMLPKEALEKTLCFDHEKIIREAIAFWPDLILTEPG